MNLDFMNNLINGTKENKFIQNFIKELGDFLENKLETGGMYSNYWGNTNFMEDGISASIGLSRWATVFTYHDELRKAVDDSILELTEREGALYRKKFMANGSINNGSFGVDKYENGEMELLKVPVNVIPEKFRDKDIIFQYKANGDVQVRPDLKEEIIKIASEKCKVLKEKEHEKTENFKEEGHVYQAFEDDGYIFLKDLTDGSKKSIEDIDFVINCYQGEGKYQVIEGVYKKIGDN